MCQCVGNPMSVPPGGWGLWAVLFLLATALTVFWVRSCGA